MLVYMCSDYTLVSYIVFDHTLDATRIAPKISITEQTDNCSTSGGGGITWVNTVINRKGTDIGRTKKSVRETCNGEGV
ncbi:hypothetical protein POVCU2_0001980 [Plasmodium ovale curtisi]|uniref:Uncharacterized protein n=1 Tax=Plasmodium ovale curtisi TaxID=864141 RepID=A0A1A8VHV8_PLAOA|nr:hypothetical protein POVCU2_0001980 [Plasmodium ovale curtisi]SBS80583.1 hypothetical protein POVCU1_001770 [Plasmodium ovale curtisi]